jgi:VIT1/CCC1 family predicted Fe2+/Mn2+ transporter
MSRHVGKIDSRTRDKILGFQKNEITEYHIYIKLAGSMKESGNRRVLKRISSEEHRHYKIWRKYTGRDVHPSRIKIWFFYLISRLLGLSFGLRLMEKGEEVAQASYEEIASKIPEARKVEKEENEHENELLNMLGEEKLKYMGSIVLGLNDALVELTGALAGFTFAFQNANIIAMAGLITGIAASISMGASEYLSTKSEGRDEEEKHPVKASVYTGFAYIVTVMLLVLPFFVLGNVYLALAVSLFNAIMVILVFTFYISVAKDLNFRRRFAEMAGISLGVAAITFLIGFLIRVGLGIEV